MLESKYYLHFEYEKMCEEVNIILNILTNFKIHDTNLTHRTYFSFTHSAASVHF